MTIDWTQVIIAICSIVITGVIIPLVRTKIAETSAKLNKEQLETVNYWVEVGVRWAKQWLQSESGEAKKEAVLAFAATKLFHLGIEVDTDDLDKIIEAIYEQVKADSAIPSVEQVV